MIHLTVDQKYMACTNMMHNCVLELHVTQMFSLAECHFPVAVENYNLCKKELIFFPGYPVFYGLKDHNVNIQTE